MHCPRYGPSPLWGLLHPGRIRRKQLWGYLLRSHHHTTTKEPAPMARLLHGPCRRSPRWPLGHVGWSLAAHTCLAAPLVCSWLQWGLPHTDSRLAWTSTLQQLQTASYLHVSYPTAVEPSPDLRPACQTHGMPHRVSACGRPMLAPAPGQSQAQAYARSQSPLT